MKKKPIYDIVKRLFDFFSSLIAIVVISPLLLVIAILVKVTSKGPVLFKDIRVGKNGKLIKVWKYRSMYIDAETNIDKYLTPEEKEIWIKERKLDKDPRITKVGRFIRKTSLDELPQLFNILTGRISVVGPRPINKKEMELNYTKEQQEVLTSVKPGLTGYWQVYGRSDVTYANGKRQEEELTYIPIRSCWLDFKIIVLTVPAVLKHKGAK